MKLLVAAVAAAGILGAAPALQMPAWIWRKPRTAWPAMQWTRSWLARPTRDVAAKYKG